MQTVLLVLGSLVVGFFVGWLPGTPANVRYLRTEPPPADDALPPPPDSPRASAEFVRELVAFADRLAARDVCVRRLACEPYWFWELLLQKGVEADQGETATQSRVTRVFWDGKEWKLSIQSAAFRPAKAPDDDTFTLPRRGVTREQVEEFLRIVKLELDAWTDELTTKIGRTGDSIGVAEGLLIRRFSGSPGTNPPPR